MKYITLIAAIFALASPVLADGHVSKDQVDGIMGFLDGVGCEMDTDDIEVEDDGGYDLDDVQCPDGQYDMTLDAEFGETGRRKE